MSKAIEKVVQGALTAAAGEAGVTFNLPDETVITINLADLPEAVIERLAVHGLSQKIGDSYAGAGKAESPLAYAKEAISETIKQLMAGDWRIAAVGGAPRLTLLVRAVARAFGQSVEAVQAIFTDKEESLSEEDYKAFVAQVRSDSAVKKAQADIKAEEAAVAAKAGPSTLAGLFGG